MLRRAMAQCAARAPQMPIEITAQQHLTPWYRRFGFEIVGEAFDWDGIMHVPMRRSATH